MEDLYPTKSISYIKARDPSILTGNLARKNYLTLFNEESKEKCNRFEIYLRIKPEDEEDGDSSSLYEINDNSLICKIARDPKNVRNVRNEVDKKTYAFTKIFDPRTSQAEIFNGVIKEKILQFINGENFTLFTYGASASGKTYTMLGTVQEPGVVPRSLEYLFRTLPNLDRLSSIKPISIGLSRKLNNARKNAEREATNNIINLVTDKKHHVETYQKMQTRLSNETVAELEMDNDVNLSVWITFAEIYNENINDLLTPESSREKPKTKFKITTNENDCYVTNLKSIQVASPLEAYLTLVYGLQNTNYAQTQINAHSSRSHSIFTIFLVQNSEGDKENASASTTATIINKFNFCDLAGSERAKKTLNVGDRLKESNNINTSLLVLGKCINAIRTRQRNPQDAGKVIPSVIPFRESKLTQLFQRALLGLESTSMIVTVSLLKTTLYESVQVLNFSAIAKNVTVEKRIEKCENVPNSSSNDDVVDKEKLLKIIRNLRKQLIKSEQNIRIETERSQNACEELIKSVKENYENYIESIGKIAENSKQELLKKNETLKNKIYNYQNILQEKDEEIEKLHSKIENLEEEQNILKAELVKYMEILK